MKSLIIKTKKTLRSKKGETLMEAIVSIVILALLLTAVTTMIMTSRRMTANSMIDAREMQEEVLNPVHLNDYGVAGDSVSVTLRGVMPGALPNIETSHYVFLYENAEYPDIIAFYSDPGGGPP